VVVLLFLHRHALRTIRDYDLVLMTLHEIISLATRAGFRVRSLRHDALQPMWKGRSIADVAIVGQLEITR
jgi:hypothetical protein